MHPTISPKSWSYYGIAPPVAKRFAKGNILQQKCEFLIGQIQEGSSPFRSICFCLVPSENTPGHIRERNEDIYFAHICLVSNKHTKSHNKSSLSLV